MKTRASLAPIVLFLLLIGPRLDAATHSKGPRPVSSAEAAAVEMMADFLSQGPEALQSRLAPESPLASMSKDAAMAEIEARVGPPDGAQWSLQTIVPSLADRKALFGVEYPSGAEDVVELTLVEHDGKFQLLSLRTLAEPSPYAIRGDWSIEEEVTTEEAPSRSLLPRLPLVGGLLVLLSLSSLVVMRARPLAGKVMIGATIVIALGSLVLLATELRTLAPTDEVIEAEGSQTEPFRSLGELATQRRAMASGNPMPVSAGLGPEAREVAAVWKAQLELRDQKLDDAAKTLERFPVGTDRPMVALLRARLAAATYDEIASSLSYERAMRLGPGRDDLWFETARWLSALGFEERAVTYLERLPLMRSRNAAVYYALASVAGANDKTVDAVVNLKTAWELEPIPRRDIVAMPALTSVMRLEEAKSLVPFSSAVEPTFRSPANPNLHITLPANATASVTGGTLAISLPPNRSLRVEGGAMLVDSSVEVIDAVDAERREQQRSLEDFPNLIATGGSGAAMADPAVRERYLRTAQALAGHHRWDDVERLTSSLSAKAENVPPDLLLLRGTALRKLHREGDAKRLLAEMAGSPAMERRSDPKILYQMGEMLAAMELYAPAIRTLEKVDAMMEDVSLDDRIRQISMNQRLAERYGELKSRNFIFHYPHDIDEPTVQRFADVMEAELARLTKIIPVKEFQPTTVNVLWWTEFRNTYTGSDHILGFYDGKITLPIAGVSRMHPVVVALMSHELAHAIIAQATADRAPAWVQEGLAQRIEMVPYHANAFNMYESDRMLPLALLNPALTSSVDGDLIGQAYITSQTAIRFLESKYGAKVIPSLLTSLRETTNDEEALAAVTGKSIEELEVEFRAWGASERRVFENRGIIRYDESRGDRPMIRHSSRTKGSR